MDKLTLWRFCRPRPLVLLSISLAAPFLAGSASAANEASDPLPAFQQDRGGVGLLQTPTARMAPTGEFSFTFDQVDPYRNFTFSLQPFDWLGVSLRYTKIRNRSFKASNGRLHYLDKGLSAKFKLLDETEYLPKVAFGMQDLGGTGLFAGEYFVGNKRWHNFDFSLGFGWGYLGNRGDVANPLDVFGNRFKRRSTKDSQGGGKFDFNRVFTGRIGFFGGIQYQTPFKPLSLQIEYDGNDYKNEPLDNSFDQKLPVNFGARLRVNDHLTLSAALERGDTAMFGGTLRVNLATIVQPKNDPPYVPPHNRKRGNEKSDQGDSREKGRDEKWQLVASKLSRNAGIGVKRIVRKDHSLIVEGRSNKYRSMPEAELRANRILHNAAGPEITQFKYRWKRRGFYLRQDTLPRSPLPRLPFITSPNSPFSSSDYRLGVTATGISRRDTAHEQGQTLFNTLDNRFSWRLGPAVNYNYGGPDGFLYQVYARLDTQFKTDRHGWFSNTLGYALFDNLGNFDFKGFSKLPRVRTHVVQYIDETTLGVYNLQYTRTGRLSRNWFGMAYAGYLERMFGGAGAEVLYRPFNSPVAFGVDANWVKQRDFDERFGFRDYSVWTGHATAYIQTGIKHILAKLSVGRYLAGDKGGTIDISRQFESGVRVGAFATFTTADGDKFGEGSFDKGLYLTLPLDIFYTQSTRQHIAIGWRPLTRDGGAQLHRRYTLYGLTQERNMADYWQNYQKTR